MNLLPRWQTIFLWGFITCLMCMGFFQFTKLYKNTKKLPTIYITYTLPKPSQEVFFCHSPSFPRSQIWRVKNFDGVWTSRQDKETVLRRDLQTFKTIEFAWEPIRFPQIFKDYPDLMISQDGSFLLFPSQFAISTDAACQTVLDFTINIKGFDTYESQNIPKDKRKSYIEFHKPKKTYVVKSEKPAYVMNLTFDNNIELSLKEHFFNKIKEFLDVYSKQLNVDPKTTEINIPFLIDDENSESFNGEVFGNSLVLNIGKEFLKKQKINSIEILLAHELFHLWNSNSYKEEDEWIHEGSAKFFETLVGSQREWQDLSDPVLLWFMDAEGQRCLKGFEGKEKYSFINAPRDSMKRLDYHCGAFLHWIAHEEIFSLAKNKKGAFAIWNYILQVTPQKNGYTWDQWKLGARKAGLSENTLSKIENFLTKPFKDVPKDFFVIKRKSIKSEVSDSKSERHLY